MANVCVTQGSNIICQTCCKLFFGGGAMFCTKQHPMYELYLIIIYFVNDESSLQVIVYKQ